MLKIFGFSIPIVVFLKNAGTGNLIVTGCHQPFHENLFLVFLISSLVAKHVQQLPVAPCILVQCK
jgi:hypothetical protein